MLCTQDMWCKWQQHELPGVAHYDDYLIPVYF